MARMLHAMQMMSARHSMSLAGRQRGHTVIGGNMETHPQSVLQALAAYQGADDPFLSIYLDWVPDGNGKRPSVRLLEDELAIVAERMAGDAAYRAGLAADRQRII